jgi:hypothetical protein
MATTSVTASRRSIGVDGVEAFLREARTPAAAPVVRPPHAWTCPSLVCRHFRPEGYAGFPERYTSALR